MDEIEKSESFATHGPGAHDACGDVAGFRQDKLSQFELYTNQIKLLQKVFRHLMREGLNQFGLTSGDKSLQFGADGSVINRFLEFIVEGSEGNSWLQEQGDGDALRLSPLRVRDPDTRPQFKFLDQNFIRRSHKPTWLREEPGATEEDPIISIPYLR